MRTSTLLSPVLLSLLLAAACGDGDPDAGRDAGDLPDGGTGAVIGSIDVIEALRWWSTEGETRWSRVAARFNATSFQP